MTPKEALHTVKFYEIKGHDKFTYRQYITAYKIIEDLVAKAEPMKPFSVRSNVQILGKSFH